MNACSFAQINIAEVKAALRERGVDWITEIDSFESIPSSNDYLMAADSPLHGRLCITDYQTHGKGRQGKQWLSSPDRNLLFSLGWSPQQNPGAQISLVVGLAIADALRGLGVENIGLKWPNDVLIAEAKLGGILLESRVQQGQFEFVIGVGLNMRQQPDELAAVENSWTDLSACGYSQIGRETLLIAVLSELDARLMQIQTQGFANIRRDWLNYHLHQGVNMQYQHNGRQCVGRVVGLDENGALQLETNGERIAVHSGEVNTLRPVG